MLQTNTGLHKKAERSPHFRMHLNNMKAVSINLFRASSMKKSSMRLLRLLTNRKLPRTNSMKTSQRKSFKHCGSISTISTLIPYLLIAKPDVEVSTAGIYGRLDAIGEYVHPDIDGLLQSIEAGDWRAAGGKLGNVLELVTTSDVPEILEIKYMMLEAGAYGALMTGSGPTVFGLFEDEAGAGECILDLEKRGLCSFLRVTQMVG